MTFSTEDELWYSREIARSRLAAPFFFTDLEEAVCRDAAPVAAGWLLILGPIED